MQLCYLFHLLFSRSLNIWDMWNIGMSNIWTSSKCLNILTEYVLSTGYHLFQFPVEVSYFLSSKDALENGIHI